MIDWYNPNNKNYSNTKVLLTHDINSTHHLITSTVLNDSNKLTIFIFDYNSNNFFNENIINNLLASSKIACIFIISNKKHVFSNISPNIKDKLYQFKYITNNILNTLLKNNTSSIFNIFNVSRYINFNNIAYNLNIIKKFCTNNNICFGKKMSNNILLGNTIVPSYFNYSNSKEKNIINDISNLNICFSLNDKKELYEYIYDTVCDYLDNEFEKKHYCSFSNDKCLANLEHKTCQNDYGCCYYIKYQGFGSFKNMGLCKYQKNKQCEIKCLPCKLFTCKFYRKQGIKYEPNDIFLLKYFFNKKQKLILKYNMYMDKKKIINKLLEKNNLPSFIYYIFGLYYIKD